MCTATIGPGGRSPPVPSHTGPCSCSPAPGQPSARAGQLQPWALPGDTRPPFRGRNPRVIHNLSAAHNAPTSWCSPAAGLGLPHDASAHPGAGPSSGRSVSSGWSRLRARRPCSAVLCAGLSPRERSRPAPRASQLLARAARRCCHHLSSCAAPRRPCLPALPRPPPTRGGRNWTRRKKVP